MTFYYKTSEDSQYLQSFVSVKDYNFEQYYGRRLSINLANSKRVFKQKFNI